MNLLNEFGSAIWGAVVAAVLALLAFNVVFKQAAPRLAKFLSILVAVTVWCSAQLYKEFTGTGLDDIARHYLALGTCRVLTFCKPKTDSSFAALPESNDKIQAIQLRISELQKDLDLGADIIAKWKATTTYFDQYKIAAEAQVSDCALQKDHLEKLKREGLNEDTKQMQQRVVQVCEERVREESAKMAKFEAVLANAHQEIDLVNERVNSIYWEKEAQSANLKLELVRQVTAYLESVSKAVDVLINSKH